MKYILKDVFCSFSILNPNQCMNYFYPWEFSLYHAFIALGLGYLEIIAALALPWSWLPIILAIKISTLWGNNNGVYQLLNWGAGLVFSILLTVTLARVLQFDAPCHYAALTDLIPALMQFCSFPFSLPDYPSVALGFCAAGFSSTSRQKVISFILGVLILARWLSFQAFLIDVTLSFGIGFLLQRGWSAYFFPWLFPDPQR